MKPLKEFFESGQTIPWIETQNTVAFLRPVPDILVWTPGPTARVAEFLCLCQISLAPTQVLLRSLALGDVAADAAIAEEPAPGVEAGLAADLVEPLLAVLHAGEAEIEEPLVRGEHRAVRGPARLVGRGGRNLPARPTQLEAEVAYPDVGLAELDRAVAVLGVGLPEEIARDLGQVAEARLGVGERQRGALALGDVSHRAHKFAVAGCIPCCVSQGVDVLGSPIRQQQTIGMLEIGGAFGSTFNN